ncbi:alpha-2 adrenergic receptor [Trichonephila clavipes]|nr:alpha-2 adrenergic receptor [Trichonephila clavipes]
MFVDVAIQPEVRFIAKQNSLMKIGNNGNLVLGPFDESTPCLMIVLMNCQTKLRINLLTAVKSVFILESNANLNFYTWKKKHSLQTPKIWHSDGLKVVSKPAFSMLNEVRWYLCDGLVVHRHRRDEATECSTEDHRT